MKNIYNIFITLFVIELCQYTRYYRSPLAEGAFKLPKGRESVEKYEYFDNEVFPSLGTCQAFLAFQWFINKGNTS